MKFEELKDKTTALIEKIRSKIGKRTVIVAVCALLVGVAVMLNVILWKAPGDKLTPADAALSGAEKVASGTSKADGYFADVILSRAQARDEALEVLAGVMNSDTAVAEMKADAEAQINRIARDMENEANIEALITSKGLGECVAVISGDTANVVVKIDGMTDAEVSQISEIVYEQSGIIPANLKIINN